MNMIDVIADLRGGIPETCDFCGNIFTKENYATPEEAGDWACITCVKHWDKQEQERNNEIFK